MTIPIPPGTLDPFLRGYRSPGTRFVLGPGRYETRGAWAFEDLDFCMLAPGCVLSGDPYGGTILAMSDPFERPGSPYFEMLTGGARSAGTSSGLVVEHLTLVAPVRPTVALHLWTSRSRVRQVRVTGLNGNRALQPGEGFGILINHAHRADVDGQHCIESCSVDLRPGAYASGIYLGLDPRPGVHLGSSVVRDCAVTVEQGGSAHCGFGVGSRSVIEGCTVTGCERPFFADTRSGIDSVIRECRAYECSIGVELRVEQSAISRERITVADCGFVFRATAPYVAGLVLVAEGAGETGVIQNVVMERCTLVQTGPVACYLGSASGPNVRGVALRHVTAGPARAEWREPQLANGAVAWEIT